MVPWEVAGDRRLAAYVVPDGDLDPAELRPHLAAALPEPMIPAVFVPLERLPLTANGKVDRRALPAPDPAANRAQGYLAPSGPVEEVLAAACAELLGIGRVGMGDNFFALGGHSLLATRLVARLRQAFGIAPPLRAVFEAPTLAALAEWIGRHPEAHPEIAPGFSPIPAPLPARLPERETVPASFAQERLWFLDRMEPGNPAFNMGSALRLRGRLEPRTLERALNEIVRRHEALRTTFAEAGGRPMQRVAPRLAVPLPVVDLSALPEGAREPAAARATRSSLAAPFDLEAGPLVRAALLRLAPDHHLFPLSFHHIVSDGWSTGVMGRELLVLYETFAAGRPSPLPPLPIQYGDYARRQREELRGEALEAQLAYWRGKLGGTLEPLELPTDRPRPPVQTFRGGTLWTEVPGEVAEALRRLAREEKGSLFMVLLAALQLLLARLSGQEDVVVGSPIAGRPRVETEELIGLFLNTLALRTDLAGDPTFRELLARVRETTLGAYAHQEVPFEALLAELRPARDLSRTPVFQVLLNMLSFPPPRGACRTAWRSRTARRRSRSRSSTSPSTSPRRGGRSTSTWSTTPTCSIRRAWRSCSGSTWRSWPPRPDDPGRRIGAFSLLTPEAAAVLPDPSRPQAAEWPGAVHRRFLERARRHPGRPAAADGDTAERLDLGGPRRRQRPPGGGADGRGGRTRRAGRRLGPPGRAAGRRPARRAAGGRGLRRPRPRLPAGPPGGGGGPGAAAGLGGGARRPAAAGGGGGGARRRPPAAGGRARPAGRSEAPDADVHPDAPAWIAFTSGSTGEPKGIVGTHRPLSHFLAWHQRDLRPGGGGPLQPPLRPGARSAAARPPHPALGGRRAARPGPGADGRAGVARRLAGGGGGHRRPPHPLHDAPAGDGGADGAPGSPPPGLLGGRGPHRRRRGAAAATRPGSPPGELLRRHRDPAGDGLEDRGRRGRRPPDAAGTGDRRRRPPGARAARGSPRGSASWGRSASAPPTWRWAIWTIPPARRSASSPRPGGASTAPGTSAATCRTARWRSPAAPTASSRSAASASSRRRSSGRWCGPEPGRRW